MIPTIFRETLWGELLLLGVITIVFFVTSRIVVFIFDKVLHSLTRKTKTSLDDLLIEALRRPIFLLVFVFGFYVALTSVNFLDTYQDPINKGLLVAELVLILYGANRIVGALATWYATEIAPRTESDLDERLLPILRRIITGFIYGIGGLTVLRTLGIDVSPVLAGLGIGGLAVALALQPTLNNLIAGAFTVSESKIGVGDYIRVEDGERPEGMIADIGWRTTKIRTAQDNIVVIPNARLADSVVTNFGAPTPETLATVRFGVSYDSNLDLVKKVVTEIAKGVIQRIPGAVPASEPIVRFVEFGDSNIDLEVLVRVKTYRDRFTVVSELVMDIHKRFRREGIQMNYPVRQLIYTPQNGAPKPLKD